MSKVIIIKKKYIYIVKVIKFIIVLLYLLKHIPYDKSFKI
jgi:hypothetical protein